jgi:hypothetical protein
MRRHMGKLLSQVSLLAILALLTALGAAGETTDRETVGLFPDLSDSVFGMVGLTANQTARLNVLHVKNRPIGLLTSDTGFPFRLYLVQLMFLSSRGKILAEKYSYLDPGRSDHLDLDGVPLLVGRQAKRVQISAVARLVPSFLLPAGKPAGKHTTEAFPIKPYYGTYVYTLEIFDTDTGEGRLIMSPSKVDRVYPIPASESSVPPHPPAD